MGVVEAFEVGHLVPGDLEDADVVLVEVEDVVLTVEVLFDLGDDDAGDDVDQDDSGEDHEGNEEEGGEVESAGEGVSETPDLQGLEVDGRPGVARDHLEEHH